MIREKKPWPSYVAAFLLNDMTGACKKRGVSINTCGVSPHEVRYLLELNYEDHIDRKTARQSLDYMLDKAAEIREFVEWVRAKIEVIKP